MKPSFKALAVTGFILACSAPKLFAPLTDAEGITVDENGNGYWVFGLNIDTGTIQTNYLTSFKILDPSGGLNRAVLVYDLGVYYNGATNGDVALVGVNNGATVSQLLRFSDGYLIYYANDGSGSMADVGMLPSFSTNLVMIANQGQAGTFWQPAGNQPGFVGGARSGTTPLDTYNFLSYLSFSTTTNKLLKIRPLYSVGPPPFGISVVTGVLLSWPTNLNNLGLALYQNDNLVHDNWMLVTNSPGITNGFSQLPLQNTGHTRFFRIMAP